MPTFLKQYRPKTVEQIIVELRHTWEELRRKRDAALSKKLGFMRGADFAMLRRLDGLEPCSGYISGADGVASVEIAIKLMEAMAYRFADDEPKTQYLHITLIPADLATSDERTMLDLAEIERRTRALLAQISADWMAVIEFGVFGNRKHPDGGKHLGPHVHVVARGSDIFAHAKAVASLENSRQPQTITNAGAVHVALVKQTLIDLQRVVRYPYKAPDRTLNAFRNNRTGAETINHSTAGDRYIRYLRIFQILSLIPRCQLMFGSGSLGYIQGETFSRAEGARALDVAADRRLRHREISKFWASLMPRLAYDRFAIPIIKMRP